MAVSGLGVVGRDNYGVFPLRGKLLNVREAGYDQIVKNVEIQHIKQILGLKHGQDYKTTDNLRYGHLMIMTDQVCISHECRYFLADQLNRTTTVPTSKALSSTFLIIITRLY